MVKPRKPRTPPWYREVPHPGARVYNTGAVYFGGKCIGMLTLNGSPGLDQDLKEYEGWRLVHDPAATEEVMSWTGGDE